MKKLASIAAAVVIAPVLFASAPVFADSPGQLSNGPTNYEVKNVTKNGNYAQSATAVCGETLRYSVLIANSDFGQLNDVTVKANVATGDINVSAKNANNDTTSVSGKVAVTANGTVTAKAGTTVRVNTNGARTVLADGVTAGGVNAGVLAGSTQTFVQFDADIKCATPPPVTPPVTPPNKIKVCELSTKNLITINENDFNASKHTKDLTKCNATPVTTTTPTKPTELVKSGAGSTAAIFAAVATMGAVAYNVVLRRRSAN